MKKVFLASIALFSIIACSPGSDDDFKPDTSTEPSGSAGGSGASGCGSYNGHVLHTGEQGGCYYYSSSGNKIYVDRSYCRC